ncbi:MAG: hypothetical protein JW891_12965 [Candidatus Lokiarchaeota archaeon]|nr:hypothetical protein [Candidatus Lokiarchaeota archaeon]
MRSKIIKNVVGTETRGVSQRDCCVLDNIPARKARSYPQLDTSLMGEFTL